MQKSYIILASLIILSGCSSTSKSNNTTSSELASSEKKRIAMKCEISSATGTKLKRKRCVDAAYAKAEREAAQKLMRDAINNQSTISKDIK